MKGFKLFGPVVQFLQLHHPSSDSWFPSLSLDDSISQMRL